MTTANERLQLALDFMNMDLRAAREGDILNAKDDVVNFVLIRHSRDLSINVKPGVVEALKYDDLLLIQHTARRLFGQFVMLRDEVRKTEGPVDMGQILMSHVIQYQSVDAAWAIYADPDSKRIHAGARVESLRDGFLVALLHLALTNETGNVRTCPVCGKLFVRTRRQEYDSPRCASKASSRKWRQEQAKATKKK